MTAKAAFDARWITREMSGIGRYSLGLLQSLAELNPDMAIAAIGGDGDLVNSAISNSKITHTPFYHSPASLKSQLMLPGLLRSNDIMLFHSPYVYAPLGGRGIKIITTVHDLIPQRCASGLRRAWKVRLAPVWNIWNKLQYRRSDAIVTVSDFSKGELIEFAHLKQEKIFRIHNGVVCPELPTRGTSFKEKFQITGDIISYIGRHDPYKNVSSLIRAFDKVASEYQGDITLVVGGKLDDRYPEDRQLAESMKFSNQIIFTDYLDESDRIRLLNESSIFVFPSKYEGFGLPPLEAMAMGVPVVASSAASLPEVLDDAAILTDPDDTEALSEGILKLLRDKEMRNKYIEAGFKQAALFTWKKCAEEHLSLYESLLK